MYKDTPITKIDEDKLNRTPFVEQIATGLVTSFKDTHESVVIGINGPWGSGKSSLLNLLEQEIERQSEEDSQEIVWINFNPWLFSGQADLQQIFLAELYQVINKKKHLKKAGKLLRKFGKLVYLSADEFIFKSKLSNIWEKLRRPPYYKEKSPLKSLKDNISKALMVANVRIYITVDDIDRLTPEEVAEIFKLVRLNLNFANTVFILSYDKTIVTNALKKIYKENGSDYIGKIVQVDYTIPHVSHDIIVEIFGDKLLELFSHNDDLVDAIKYQIEYLPDASFLESLKIANYVKYLQTLRDAYRFLNAIKLRLESIYQDVVIPYFLEVEALRLFDYDTYLFILESKNLLLGIDYFTLLERYPEIKNQGNLAGPLKFIDSYKCSNTSKKIIKNLFDRSAFSKYNPRIRQRDFDRYFTLQVEINQVSQSELDSYINGNLEEKRVIFQKLSIGKSFDMIEQVEETSKLFDKQHEHSKKALLTDTLELCFEKVLKTPPEFKLNRRGLSCMHIRYQHIMDPLYREIPDYKIRREIIFAHIEDALYKKNFSAFFNTYTILKTGNLIRESKQINFNLRRATLFTNEAQIDQPFIEKINTYYLQFWTDANMDIHVLLSAIHFIMLKTNTGRDNFYLCNFSKAGFLHGGINFENLDKRLTNIGNDVELSKIETQVVELFKQAYKDGLLLNRYYNPENPSDFIDIPTVESKR